MPNRRSPPDPDWADGELAHRPSRKLQEQMEQLVDNDTRQSVGPIGRQQVAGVFGTRVAQTILASDDNDRSNRPDIWMPAIDPLKKLLCHGGRPHMGPGLRRDDSECVAGSVHK
jgi:hypothetical protein